MSQLLKTTDYTIFKKTNLNRNLTSAHLKNLEKIILSSNCLSLHPLICNNKMEIIDGQHRFEIAKRNNLELYYFVDDKISYQHILHSNLYQKKLPIKEVIRFYALKDKKEDYIILLDFINSLNLNIRSILCLLFGMSSSRLIKLIKEGNFILPEKMEAFEMIALSFLEFMTFIQVRNVKPFSMFSNFNFCLAFRMLTLNNDFDIELFKKKLENQWYTLKPQVNHKEWYKLLINIYNWKNHNPL